MSTRWVGRQQWQSCSTEGHARQAGVAAGVAGCSSGHISQSSLSCQPTYGLCRLMRLIKLVWHRPGKGQIVMQSRARPLPACTSVNGRAQDHYHAKTVQANRTQHCSKQQLVRQCRITWTSARSKTEAASSPRVLNYCRADGWHLLHSKVYSTMVRLSSVQSTTVGRYASRKGCTGRHTLQRDATTV